MKRAIILLCLLLAGCGGGGSSGGGADNNAVLSWSPPTTWSDNVTILDPMLDIEQYDIYANDGTRDFTPDDLVASVAGVDNGVIVTSFNIGKLGLHGNLLICMKTIGFDGTESEYSMPIFWVQEDL